MKLQHHQEADPFALIEGTLLNASANISIPYMRLPIAGSDPGYKERVYCYELYYQWKSIWPKGTPFWLCGEVDKRGHAFVKGQYVDNTKPDFLIHIPGTMSSDANLLIVEVKRADGNKDEIVADLQKLTAFRTCLHDEHGAPANYMHAFLWLFGAKPKWEDLRSDLCKRMKGAKNIDLSLIRCFVHENPDERAKERFWK